MIKEKELAVDIESENNLHHYGTKLALIQIASKKKVWLIDPLAIKNLEAVKKILEDERIIKVFHDTSFDFSILSTINCKPKNIIDTHRAALLLGKQPSLNMLMKEFLRSGKAGDEQKADWLKRPLSEKMMTYAAQDVAQLLELKDAMIKELEKLGRKEWLLEDCEKIEIKEIPKPDYHCLKGSSQLTPKQRGVLKELFNLRELIAKKIDKPVFFIIKHSTLIRLAIKPPRSINSWKKLRGVHPVVNKNAEKFYSAVKKGLMKPEDHKPCKNRIVISKAANELLRIRDEEASKLGIEGFVLMTKEQAKQIIINKSLKPLKNWQKKILIKHPEFLKYDK